MNNQKPQQNQGNFTYNKADWETLQEVDLAIPGKQEGVRIRIYRKVTDTVPRFAMHELYVDDSGKTKPGKQIRIHPSLLKGLAQAFTSMSDIYEKKYKAVAEQQMQQQNNNQNNRQF